MKLRVRGSSLRLRVTRGEVEQLRAGAVVAESVAFGSGSLIYALTVADVPAMRASFDGGRIEVTLPRAQAERWLRSEEVGMQARQEVGEGGPLQLLVEKDFACLKPRQGEDDADAFPHPLTNPR